MARATHVRGHYRVSGKSRRRAGGKGVLEQALPWLIGAGAIGLLLIPSAAFAATPQGRAMILVNLQPRTRPDPNAPELYPGDPNPNGPAGMVVTVLERGIRSTSPASREWWKVRFPDGKEGYLSAIGPSGEANLRML